MARQVGDDLTQARLDAGASKAAVARAAGIDRTFYGRIEAGDAHPSLETLVAIGVALGSDVSIRMFTGTGSPLTDHVSAAMTQSLLGELAPVWRPHLEVAVWRPARGVIDLVLERRDTASLVAGEVQSWLRRLEQLVRWSGQKADSLGSSTLVGGRPTPLVSGLLVVRSTDANRTVARAYEAVMRTAYPARTADAVASLREGEPWPGAAIVWVRMDGSIVHLLDGPPRGVALGR